MNYFIIALDNKNTINFVAEVLVDKLIFLELL